MVYSNVEDVRRYRKCFWHLFAYQVCRLRSHSNLSFGAANFLNLKIYHELTFSRR